MPSSPPTHPAPPPSRAARIHFLIMGHLRKQMPYFGQKKAQERLLDNLPQEFLQVQREYHLHPGEAGGCTPGCVCGVCGGWVPPAPR